LKVIPGPKIKAHDAVVGLEARELLLDPDVTGLI
jgi:hypothetical protein